MKDDARSLIRSSASATNRSVRCPSKSMRKMYRSEAALRGARFDLQHVDPPLRQLAERQVERARTVGFEVEADRGLVLPRRLVILGRQHDEPGAVPRDVLDVAFAHEGAENLGRPHARYGRRPPPVDLHVLHGPHGAQRGDGLRPRKPACQIFPALGERLRVGVDDPYLVEIDIALRQQTVVDRKDDLTPDPEVRVVDEDVGRQGDGTFRTVLKRDDRLVDVPHLHRLHDARDVPERHVTRRRIVRQRRLLAERSGRPEVADLRPSPPDSPDGLRKLPRTAAQRVHPARYVGRGAVVTPAPPRSSMWRQPPLAFDRPCGDKRSAIE